MDLDSLHPAVSLADEPLSRREYCRTWRHPLHRSIEVPYSTAMVMALIQMGVSDYAVIAKAAGLHIADVRRIDMVEDCAVRQLGVAGIPHGVYFKLHETVRCPKCKALVRVAPCIACNTMADASLGECVEPDGDLPAGEHFHR